MKPTEERAKANKEKLEDIANALQKSGYQIGDFISGRIIDAPKANALGRYTHMGIITVQQLSFFGIKTPEVGIYLAELWIDNNVRKADPEKHWVLDVYGSGQLESAERFATDLGQRYNVKVSTTIANDKIRLVGQELCFPGLFQK